MPRVAVIIPALNGKEAIPATSDCVTVVDNGSTDATAARVWRRTAAGRRPR